MSNRGDELSRSEYGTYLASAHLADFVRDLRERGLLTGQVCASVASSLEDFRKRRTGDPNQTWHSDLYDQYEELHGHPPLPASTD